MKSISGHFRQHVLWRGLYFFSVLLINIGIARFFAAEKSGQIFFIISNLSLILLIAGASLESGFSYYISSGQLEAGKAANFCLVWATGASLVAAAAWGLLLQITGSIYIGDPGFLLASFFFILGVLFTTYFTALFYAKKEFGLPNRILFLVNMLILVLLVSMKNEPEYKSHFIEIYFSGYFLQGIVLRIFFFRKYAGKESSMFPTGAMLKKVMHYSLIALYANLIYFLVNRIDYWFVRHYCSASDLGNYIQASRLSQLLVVLPAIVGSTLFPVFSSSVNSRDGKALAPVIRILLWMNGGICFLIVSLGWYFIPLVFGVTFGKMCILFAFLIPGILSISMNYPIAAWFSSANKISTNIRGSLLALAVICMGDLILLPVYGILVAPLVSSTGFFCHYCYSVYILRKEYDVSPREFLLLKKSDLSRIMKLPVNDFKEPVPENQVL
jgi:O-antigen/teichoic acid export membrane protein